MKKILVMPVKNEDWILDLSLQRASLWADHIIVADQNSIDKTPEICGKFEKVIYFKNELHNLNQSHSRQLLLDKVRELFGNNNIIIALDADEILSANILNNADFENEINNLQPGESIVLQWIMLSKNIYSHIVEKNSIWSENYKHFIFHDDGKFNFSDKKTSEPRMPEDYMQKSVKNNAIKVLHFHFLDFERMLSKQRRYRIFDFLEQCSIKRAIKINRMYFETKNIAELKITESPKEWLDKYQDLINNFSIKKENFYWYDLESLKKFNEFGANKFAWLDIWDVDWEEKRKIAIEKGHQDEVPQSIIKDPRNIFQKFYHSTMQRFISDNSIIYKLFKFFKK